MTEGGSLVPLIVNWPNAIKKGIVSKDLIDATDFIPTFAELAGAPLPTNNILDGKSFAYQLKGSSGTPRDWIFTELGNDWYVRSSNWKLNRAGKLFDMRNAPFEEKEVNIDETNKVEKEKLQKILDGLNPAAGYLDNGDGSGRHATKVKEKKEGKN